MGFRAAIAAFARPKTVYLMSFLSSNLLVRGLDTYVNINNLHISIDPQIPNNQQNKTLTHVCAPDRIRIRDLRCLTEIGFYAKLQAIAEAVVTCHSTVSFFD